MIFYATKETLERYKLKTPEQMSEPMRPIVKAVIEKEQGDPMYEWGCKLFHFDRIANRSIIARLNHIQSSWAWDGQRFYEYVRGGILYTKEINRDVNNYLLSTKENGKTEYRLPYRYFEEIIKKEFGN